MFVLALLGFTHASLSGEWCSENLHPSLQNVPTPENSAFFDMEHNAQPGSINTENDDPNMWTDSLSTKMYRWGLHMRDKAQRATGLEAESPAPEEEENCLWCDLRPPFLRRVESFIVSEGPEMNATFLLHRFESVLRLSLGEPHMTRTTTSDGGVWIHGSVGKFMLSAFFHPSKEHSAAIWCSVNKRLLPSSPQKSPPGKWAVAFGFTNGPTGKVALWRVW